jgi:hypothetical protein
MHLSNYTILLQAIVYIYCAVFIEYSFYYSIYHPQQAAAATTASNQSILAS